MASLLLLYFFETMFAELSLRVNTCHVLEKPPLPGRKKQHCWITSCAAAGLTVGTNAREMAYRLLPHSLFVHAPALLGGFIFFKCFKDFSFNSVPVIPSTWKLPSFLWKLPKRDAIINVAQRGLQNKLHLLCLILVPIIIIPPYV